MKRDYGHIDSSLYKRQERTGVQTQMTEMLEGKETEMQQKLKEMVPQHGQHIFISLEDKGISQEKQRLLQLCKVGLVWP